MPTAEDTRPKKPKTRDNQPWLLVGTDAKGAPILHVPEGMDPPLTPEASVGPCAKCGRKMILRHPLGLELSGKDMFCGRPCRE